MSAILAVYHRNGTPVEPGLLERMFAQQPAPAVDGQDCRVTGHIGLGHQHFWVTPQEQGERQPLTIAPGGLTVTADCRLDNRAELIHALKLEAENADGYSDAQLIVWAYLAWNTACVDHLQGDFAFAIWDAARQHLFLARDRVGACGLAYWCSGQLLVAATEISHILAHPQLQPRINEAQIARFLRQHFEEDEQTYYQEIFYLPPAHCLLVTPDELRKWRYWELDPGRRIRYGSDAEYAEHLYELLQRTVRDRLRAVGKVGISLSGGLDSSSLAAVLATEARAEQRPLHSFSYAFDELTSCDERAYISQTVDRHGYDATYIPCDDRWTLRDIEQWPVLRDFVASDPYALLPQGVIEAAHSADCRLLFGGYYGDILFTGGRFWLHSLLSQGKIGQAMAILTSSGKQIRRHRLLVDDGVYRFAPAWAKKIGKRFIRSAVAENPPAMHPDLARRTAQSQSPGALATDQWVSRLDSRPAAARRRSLHIPIFAQGAAATRHLYDGKRIAIAMPYWDTRLMEYLLAIPADQLELPGQDRRVLRNAVKPYLPQAVAQRPPRTVFVPLMQRGLQDREIETIRGLLAAPRIVEIGFVRREWLDSALASLNLWGEDAFRLWSCVALELWLLRYW